jgi:hypothetical protein
MGSRKTLQLATIVIPDEAKPRSGIQMHSFSWIPACAGMTNMLTEGPNFTSVPSPSLVSDQSR